MTTLHADVLPKEGENGWFGNRETEFRLCDCGCGRPTSYFAGTDNDWCEEQTMELRGDDPGMSLSDMMALTQMMESGSGLGGLLGSLLGGSGRSGISIGNPIVVEQRPGETEEDAIARALGEMMGGSPSGGDPLGDLFNPIPKNPRNLGNLFGLLGRNSQRGVPQGRFFDPDDPFAFLRGIGGNGPTAEQELDPDWQGEQPDFLGMARRQNPPTDWSWLDEQDPGSVDHLNRNPGQESGDKPDSESTDED